MSKRRRARRQTRQAAFHDLVDRCPFRTLIGTGRDLADMMERVGCTIAVLGETPEPMSQRMLADALTVLQAGKVVLLISNDRALRDYAKREIMSMAGPAGGAA